MNIDFNTSDPDLARSPVVGKIEEARTVSVMAHRHVRHQLIFASKGVLHVSTALGQWVLPTSRAIWISGGVEHSLSASRPTVTKVLYIDPALKPPERWGVCEVLNANPLVGELISACAEQRWNYRSDSPEERLAFVLLDQLQSLSQAPVDLPLPRDPRALRLITQLSENPASRVPLETLAKQIGSTPRTLERIFIKETKITVGAWRTRRRMLFALELIAYGESVSDVAFQVGYESASSFIAAFKSTYGATPTKYFAR